MSFSVPIFAKDRLLASLTIRFSITAVPEADAIARFIPKMKAVAQRIGHDFLAQNEHQALAIAADAPGTAGSGN
jgi:hypothetical protein